MISMATLKRLASVATALVLVASATFATVYHCGAEHCRYNININGNWETRIVDEGTLIGIDGNKELIGEGWNPVG